MRNIKNKVKNWISNNLKISILILALVIIVLIASITKHYLEMPKVQQFLNTGLSNMSIKHLLAIIVFYCLFRNTTIEVEVKK